MTLQTVNVRLIAKCQQINAHAFGMAGYTFLYPVLIILRNIPVPWAISNAACFGQFWVWARRLEWFSFLRYQPIAFFQASSDSENKMICEWPLWNVNYTFWALFCKTFSLTSFTFRISSPLLLFFFSFYLLFSQTEKSATKVQYKPSRPRWLK